MLTLVSWLWGSGVHREVYSGRDVVRLDNALRSYVSQPYRHICITDRPEEIPAPIETYRLWPELSDLGGCYRRLKLFNHPDFEGRIVSLDLDSIIVDDLDPLFDRPEPLVLWQSRTTQSLYNGSMFMFDSRYNKDIYNTFSLDRLAEQRDSLVGTDQAWLSIVRPNAAVWTPERDGVVAYKQHVRHGLTDNARIVFFPGTIKGHMKHVQERHDWARDYYNIF